MLRLLKYLAGGITRDAFRKYIPFALLFGRASPADGCLRFVNSDSNEARTLSTLITGGLNMVEYCLDACEGFAFAGMEFGAECCTCRLFE